MKNLFPAILITGLIYIVNLLGFTEPVQTNGNLNKVYSSGTNVEIKALHALGRVPIKYGQPDILEINLVNNDPGEYVDLRISLYDRSNNQFISDEVVEINDPGVYNRIVYYPLPRQLTIKDVRIVVEAIPGSALDNFAAAGSALDSMSICQDVTYDTYNYADPCLADDGGFGFQGRTGNFVAGFRNKDSLPMIINAVEQKFFDSVGGGNKPYNIVIYNDNGSGKPGSLIYKSPNLLTPAGTGFPVALTPYQINTTLTIPSGQRFFVGYRQTSVNSIKAAFQNEVPIRDSSFFFTAADTNVWFDFSDSSKNSKIDIAAVVGKSDVKIKFIMEGFYDIPTNNLNMTDTVKAYLRNVSAPYAIVDSSTGILDSITFESSHQFPGVPSGTYYIQVKHRNTLETWSKFGVNYTQGLTLNYDFTTVASQAYGNNEILKGTKFCLFSGDVDQNGSIDLTDLIAISNNASNFVTGYVNTDVNGNNITDLTDVLICYNNSAMFVSKITPP